MKARGWVVLGVALFGMVAQAARADGWDGDRPWGHGHYLRVDRDDRDDDGFGWWPLFFGLRAIAPPQRVVVEHSYYYAPPPPAPAYAPPPSAYWYYCRQPAGYYPQVPSCPSGWLQVNPQGAPPP